MPKYYHIHRGTKPSKVDKKFIEGQSLFFSKKNSTWYNIEKEISKEKEYGGFYEYEIYIPATRFTTSFNPRTKNKIVKITHKNIDEFISLIMHQYKNRNLFIEEMKRRNIIGIDATSDFMYKYVHITGGPPEGFIWKKPTDIKIICIGRTKF